MSGVGLVAVAFCGGYTVRFGPKDPFAICSLTYGALAYSLDVVTRDDHARTWSLMRASLAPWEDIFGALMDQAINGEAQVVARVSRSATIFVEDNVGACHRICCHFCSFLFAYASDVPLQ